MILYYVYFSAQSFRFYGLCHINMIMKKILCVVLTSSDISACKRAVNSLPEHANVHVMCNSQNNRYLSELRHSDIDVPIYHSVSNGTPGCGKQSVIDHFLNTDYDYLLQIDGDDFLYLTGYDMISDYLNQKQPDVLGLLNEDILIDQNIFSCWRDFDFTAVTQSFNQDMQGMNQYFRDIFATIMQQGCVFHRILCLSKKAAGTVQYNQELPGTEDILLSAQLKLLHLQEQIQYHLIESSDIYLYHKKTNQGEGYKVLHADPDFCREQFFQEFDKQQLQLLRSTELPHTKLSEVSNRFKRLKHVKKYFKRHQ